MLLGHFTTLDSRPRAAGCQNPVVRVVMSGASGLIGSALLPALRADGHDVVRLVRRKSTGSDEIRWDPAAGELDAARLGGVDAIVNLSGAEHRAVGPMRGSARSSRRAPDHDLLARQRRRSIPARPSSCAHRRSAPTAIVATRS
jgi:uncharacterized protein YbjT (DUF2867 family)